MGANQSFKVTKDLEKSFDEFFSKFLEFPQAFIYTSFTYLLTWTIVDVFKSPSKF